MSTAGAVEGEDPTTTTTTVAETTTTVAETTTTEAGDTTTTSEATTTTSPPTTAAPPPTTAAPPPTTQPPVVTTAVPEPTTSTTVSALIVEPPTTSTTSTTEAGASAGDSFTAAPPRVTDAAEQRVRSVVLGLMVVAVLLFALTVWYWFLTRPEVRTARSTPGVERR